MAQDRIAVTADFSDVIQEIREWAIANLKLVESEDLLISVTQKVVKGNTSLSASIQGVNTAGEKQSTTVKNLINDWQVVAQTSKVVDSAVKKQTQAINENIKAQERAAAASERAAAAASKRANIQASVSRTFAFQQFNLPARGLSDQTRFTIKDQIGQLTQYVRANRVSADQVKKIWQEVEAGRFRAYEGANRQIQSRVYKLQQLRTRANEEFRKGVADSFARTGKATDRATAATRRFAAGAREANKASQGILLSWESIGRIIVGQIIRRAFLAFIQSVRQAVEVADDFLIKIGEVQTLSQQNQLSTAEWAKGLTQLSDAFGTDILDQTEAAYQALSNQVAEGAETFKFLESANRLALATVSSTSDSVNALTAVLNSYNLGAQESEAVSASLFKTVELGRLRLTEIANTIGNVTALASQLGIGYNEVNAALATLTIRGVKANQAMTQIRGIFAKLIKPTTEMKDLFREMGVTSGEQLIASLGGLEGFLDKLANTTEGSTTELGKYISRLRGLSGAAILTSREGLAQFRDNLESLREGTESYNKAIELTTQNIGKRFQIELNKAKNAFISEFGTPIIEASVSIIDYFGGLDRIVRVLSKTITVALIPAVGALALLLANLALTNPFGLLITGAAAAALIAASLVERIEASQEAYTKKLEEEEKKRREAIEKGVQENLRAAEKGLDGYTNFVEGIFAATNRGINAQTEETVKAFEELEPTIKRILNEFRKGASGALQEVTKELRGVEKSISDITTEIDKTLEGLSEELFQIELADLDVGDQIKRLEQAYRGAIDFAQEGIGAGQTDVVKRRLKAADDLFKQLRRLQDKAVKENIKIEERQGNIQAKIAKTRAEALIKERKLLEEIKEAKKTDDRSKERKLERDLAELRDKAKVSVSEEERKLKNITKIEFERVNLARQLLEAKARYVKILDEQQKKEIANQAELEKQRASLKRLTGQVTEATKRVESFDIKDFFEQDTVQGVNTLLEDRRSAIQKVLELSKDARLADVITKKDREDLLALEKRFQEAAAQRAATLRVEIERQKVLNSLRQQRERIRGLREERIEIENTRKTTVDYIDSITESLSKSTDISIGTLTNDLTSLREALLEGVADETVIRRSEAIRKRLVELADTARNIARQQRAGVSFRNFTEERARLGVGQRSEEIEEFARRAQLTANQLRDAEELFKRNQAVIEQEKRIDSLLKRVAEASGEIVKQTRNNNEETKTFAERVKEVESGWTNVVLEVQSLESVLSDRQQQAEQLLRTLDAFGLGVQRQATGGFIRLAGGGNVGTDTVPAMLSPGEFVVNARSSKRFFSQLVAMNAAGNRGFANGGNVNVGDVNVSMTSSGNESVDVVRIGKLLRREIRRGTLRL